MQYGLKLIYSFATALIGWVTNERERYALAITINTVDETRTRLSPGIGERSPHGMTIEPANQYLCFLSSPISTEIYIDTLLQLSDKVCVGNRGTIDIVYLASKGGNDLNIMPGRYCPGKQKCRSINRGIVPSISKIADPRIGLSP